MRAVPLTMRAKRSAISCRCELNVSIQINKGSSYRMVLHNPGSAVCVCIFACLAWASFVCISWHYEQYGQHFVWMHHLSGCLHCQSESFLSLSLPSESFALLRRMFSYHKVRQHNVVVAIVVRQAGSQHRPPSLPPARCAPFDVLHFFFLFSFYNSAQLELESTWVEKRRSCRPVKAVKIFFIPLFA